MPKSIERYHPAVLQHSSACSLKHPGLVGIATLLRRHLSMGMMRLALLKGLKTQIAFPTNSAPSPIDNLPAVPVVQGRIRHGGEDAVAGVDVVHAAAGARIHDFDVLGRCLRVRVVDADVGVAFRVVVWVTGPALLHQGLGEGDDHFRVGVEGAAGG